MPTSFHSDGRHRTSFLRSVASAALVALVVFGALLGVVGAAGVETASAQYGPESTTTAAGVAPAVEDRGTTEGVGAPSGDLPTTGSDGVEGWVVVGVALVAVGATVLLVGVGPRRRSAAR